MSENIPEIVGLSAFTDNYIWVIRKAGLAIVVDPGDAAPVLRHRIVRNYRTIVRVAIVLPSRTLSSCIARNRTFWIAPSFISYVFIARVRTVSHCTGSYRVVSSLYYTSARFARVRT